MPFYLPIGSNQILWYMYCQSDSKPPFTYHDREKASDTPAEVKTYSRPDRRPDPNIRNSFYGFTISFGAASNVIPFPPSAHPTHPRLTRSVNGSISKSITTTCLTNSVLVSRMCFVDRLTFRLYSRCSRETFFILTVK